MFSIDQNSHSLWDALPKVQALAAAGHAVTHFIEDIDVAFTSMGAEVDASPLRLVRERFHRSGGADWGAALFYSEFLGRQAVEVRQWEPYTGQKTAALAKQLGRSVNSLYDEFSPGDNWQLVGPSYVGDDAHHRTIADLTTAEAAPFLRELLAKARANTLESFPSAASRERTEAWFDAEAARLESAIQDSPRLVDVYRKWMGEHCPEPGITLRKTSELFATGQPRQDVLDLFTRDYAATAGLYNQALEACDVGLRPLRTDAGELPFFAAYEHAGHVVRSNAFLDGRSVRIADRTFPLNAAGGLPREELASAGVQCLAGKAIVLVLQARYGRDGQPLALPHRGSVYMPAAHRLERLLREQGLLREPVQPVIRVRLFLLDRLRELDTPMVVPPYLRPYLGRSEVPARQFGEAWRDLVAQATARLEGFKDEAFRRRWQEQTFADTVAEIDALDARRRELAKADPKGQALRGVWDEIKLRRLKMLKGLLRQIAGDWQVRDLEYWDSRGAILPWCVALGGDEFYRSVLARAEVRAESDQM